MSMVATCGTGRPRPPSFPSDPVVIDVPVREAATVLVVRDGDEGLEVLMLRRTTAAVFSPGAHVFPGGALDDDDRSAAMAARCAARGDAQEGGGLAFFVAAV